MTILVVTPRYSPYVGGIETLMLDLLPALRDRGRDIVVVTGVDDEQGRSDVVDGIPVHRLPFAKALRSTDPGAMFDVMSQLRAIELEHDVRVRHMHGLDLATYWFAWREHRRRPLPFVVSVHGTLEELTWAEGAHGMLRDADVVTAVSEAVRDYVEREVTGLRGSVTVIPNGLRPPVVDGPDADPVPGALLLAGRIDTTKGFDVAIEALAVLRASHPHARVRIAGAGFEEAALRRRCRELGLGDRVAFLGFLPRQAMLAEMQRAQAVLVPSRDTEGFGLVALEAAHMGRPVIASRVGGLPEVVRDGETGMIVDANDPAALAVAIAALLDAPERAAAMGQRAREHAMAHDLDVCADRYDALYTSVEDARARGVLAGSGG
jgi:glycosyltransferase involved in cell wall biosynthesis